MVSETPVLSIVLCTFNRAAALAGAIDALLAQTPGHPPFELVIVDNNSTDDTRRVVARAASDPRVRYVFERRQGLSYARNTGIQANRAPIVAFTDDDTRVSADFVDRIVRGLAARPEVAWIGGRVLPRWEESPPRWLDDVGYAPLALVDHGEHGFAVDPHRPICIVGANLAVRRAALEQAGGFSPIVQRVGDTIGSTEDHELQIRFWRAGLTGWYDPAIVVYADVPAERLRKRYHRRWHQGHGRFYALMRDPAFEQSTVGAWRGIPAHVFRAVVSELEAWLADGLRLRSSAFTHELRLRFLTGFVWQRLLKPEL